MLKNIIYASGNEKRASGNGRKASGNSIKASGNGIKASGNDRKVSRLLKNSYIIKKHILCFIS